MTTIHIQTSSLPLSLEEPHITLTSPTANTKGLLPTLLSPITPITSLLSSLFSVFSPTTATVRKPLLPTIRHHTAITATDHELKFEGAAFQQVILESSKQPQQHLGDALAPSSSLLIASPYTAPSHLLDLARLTDSPTSILFALALTAMRNTLPTYATSPYLDSFNWSSIFSILQQLTTTHNYSWPTTTFYVVTFRSKRNASFLHAGSGLGKTGTATLTVSGKTHDIGALDAASHEEAMQSGGLLKYWFGDPDEEGQNLATCIWRSREDAKKGGGGPGHANAMRAARDLYEYFRFERFKLTVSEGVKGWELEPWSD